MVLIDREELKMYLKTIQKNFCATCQKRTCNCELYCELPDFLKEEMGRVIDLQMVIKQKGEETE